MAKIPHAGETRDYVDPTPPAASRDYKELHEVTLRGDVGGVWTQNVAFAEPPTGIDASAALKRWSWILHHHG
ncbi:hypothetical protein EMCG_00298 [[Emmonsia] crescens]|uniref:Uncharacterized protein n=1 Tax=[Emmonsia] crescens TaxID=73230 RepID=A0A0G2HZN7_9EURO|nr:hypothetical protein EMCG_00298 [Emmonsia crescens UAMH 3008]